jgi:hypothetical protein
MMTILLTLFKHCGHNYMKVIQLLKSAKQDGQKQQQ